MGFGIFVGSLVVSSGGYENFENGVLILIGLTTFSTLAKHFSETLPVAKTAEQ